MLGLANPVAVVLIRQRKAWFGGRCWDV